MVTIPISSNGNNDRLSASPNRLFMTLLTNQKRGNHVKMWERKTKMMEGNSLWTWSFAHLLWWQKILMVASLSIFCDGDIPKCWLLCYKCIFIHHYVISVLEKKQKNKNKHKTKTKKQKNSKQTKTFRTDW